MSANRFRIAVLGAGPAGLAAARFIQDGGHLATVFEADSRIGGKSYSVINGDALNELGTCYTTRAHRLVKRWMREQGIELRRLGEARFDGSTVVKYVRGGSGPPLAYQAFKFILAARALRHRIESRPMDLAVRDEAALSTQAWIRQLDLPKIELAMHRVQTTQGYGYIDEATIGQTVQWCDFDFIISGVLNQLHMPVEGWTEFWTRFAADMDVRLNSAVTALDRGGQHPVVHTKQGADAFDAVISTLPMEVFVNLTDPSRDEEFISQAIDWQKYTTTLLTSPDWFDDHQVIGFSRASRDSLHRGAILGGRREGESEQLGGKLYVTGQFSTGLTDPELREILQAEADLYGFHIGAIIQQKSWQYFPQYKPGAVAAGLFGYLKRVQGNHRTWFAGATFSHELVSNVVAQAQQVVPQMLRTLASYPYREQLGVPANDAGPGRVPDRFDPRELVL